MSEHNINTMCLSHVTATDKQQASLNKNRSSWLASFNNSEHERAASTAILSAKNHAATCGVTKMLNGRLTIHTYCAGKSKRPMDFRFLSIFSIYAPQSTAEKDPDYPNDDPREAFLKKVLKEIHRYREKGHIIIVTGDFNLAPNWKKDRSTKKAIGEELRKNNAGLYHAIRNSGRMARNTRRSRSIHHAQYNRL